MHRHLPAELRLVGNKYLKDEFKRHKDAEIYHVGIFMREWNAYYTDLGNQLLQTGSSAKFGKSLDQRTLNDLSDAQVGQLFELRKAARGEKE